MPPDSAFSVVIIGGGFCGAMTLVHLINKSEKRISITLINKGYPLARGIAYQTYSDRHLLNVEARNMSAFPEDKDHFLDWCRKQNGVPVDDALPYTYLPRNLYGKYLDELIVEKLRNVPDHISINIIDDVVSDVERENERLIVSTASGNKFHADKVVLATGNCEPGPPTLSDPGFLNSKRYFANPWSENAVTGLSDDESVLIIGTGLTMVDVILGLREKNFRGKIIALSPHGFNILAHRQATPQRYILDELAPPYNLENLFLLFYKHIRLARKRGQSGETVVDAIRAKTQEIWQDLSLVDKKKFMTHLRHLWGVARHRLPAHIHSEIQLMIKENKLEVIAGRISGISECENGIEVKIQKRKDQTEFILRVGRIINCTGPQTDIRKQKSTLYERLIKKQMIRSDEMNLGVEATAVGQVIDENNTVSQQMFAIGSLLKGKLWESTAIPELRIQAQKVAELILKNDS